jgi:hypothetical protein
VSIEWTGNRDCLEWPHITDRVDHFAAVLDESAPESDYQTALVDLLGDAMHFAESSKCDFEEALRVAREHYETEVEREKDGAHVCDTEATE